MRINKYVALATGVSRRQADKLIVSDKVSINDRIARLGDSVDEKDVIKLDGKKISAQEFTTIALNKPVGYVCSRQGQGSKTIYDLLPQEFYNLKPIGRLDKESSGLILLTNDGTLAQKLSHPSNNKQKVYKITLNKILTKNKQEMIKRGVDLNDGKSTLKINGSGKSWTVTMSEGRNRQIRRTFSAIGCNVVKLHRTQFGEHKLGNIKAGSFVKIVHKL